MSVVNKYDVQKVTVASQEDTQQIIARLGSKDGLIRQSARQGLEEIGKPIVPLLLESLENSSNEHQRWEILKILDHLRDPESAPDLVEMLQDERAGNRWLAADALVNLGYWGLEPLLQGLVNNFSSVWFREGAHHILRAFHEKGMLNSDIEHILAALEGVEPAVEAPWAAETALERMHRAQERDAIRRQQNSK